jgi:hypothetical protein
MPWRTLSFKWSIQHGAELVKHQKWIDVGKCQSGKSSIHGKPRSLDTAPTWSDLHYGPLA